MPSVSETKIEVLEVKINKADAEAAIIALAKQSVTSGGRTNQIDDQYPPYLFKDGYGEYVVTFRKKRYEPAPPPRVVGEASS